MEKFFAYQKDGRLPCKYGRKCFQTNKEHVDKYKHPPKKDDVQVKIKKKTRKGDSKEKVKSNNTNSNGESSNANHRNNLNENNHDSYETNNMEVLEQSNITVNTVESEASSNPINNQQNSIEYVMPSMRQRSQQQQQLLLSNAALEDCSGDDGIVPCTPTLCIPRRFDGETVSSPHVPSSNQVQRFTFVGESQGTQITDLNDGEQPGSSEQSILPHIENDTKYWNSIISQLFLIGDMPEEFYEFWNFCKTQNSAHPEDALLSVGLKLVGPYDVLAGHIDRFDKTDSEKNVLHWRYYFDPPEFQTILASTTGSQYHIGYFRDQPLHLPVNVVSNEPDKSCEIKKLGKSLFHALKKYLHKLKNNGKARGLKKLMISYTKENVIHELEGRKACNLSKVARSFHRAGIIVPYESTTDVGYRPLLESEKTLHEILRCYREASESKKIEVMDKLQPIINYANIASDECDFGTGLELGIDIFCDGNPELHRICKQLLMTAYNLLRRPQFAIIIQAHLNNRKSGSNMSIF